MENSLHQVNHKYREWKNSRDVDFVFREWVNKQDKKSSCLFEPSQMKEFASYFVEKILGTPLK